MARGMTIWDLADAASIHYTTLGPIERERRAPTWHTLCLIAGGLDLTVADVIRHAEEVAKMRSTSTGKGIL
jgi:DNA-binding XRE family transcriptional regulator